MTIAYGGKANGARGNSNPKTFTINCAAGSGLLVLTLVIDGATARTGGAPTYNSVALTQADQARQASVAPETTVEMWYLLDPPTGSSYTISIPNSGALNITAEASFYSCAAGDKIKLRSASYATGTSTNPTGPTHANVVSTDLIIAVLGFGDDAFSSTQSGTSLYYIDDGTYGDSSQYDFGKSQLTWTDSTNDDWAIISAVFYEASNLPSSAAVGISKSNAYAVIQPPDGPNISKAVAYAVLSTEVNVCISKALAYAVLASVIPSNGGPFIHLFFTAGAQDDTTDINWKWTDGTDMQWTDGTNIKRS